MRFITTVACTLGLLPLTSAHHSGLHVRQTEQTVVADPGTILNGIPFATRAHWMRVANQALSDLSSPCPFAAFGTAIVNHTSSGLGSLICIGANNNTQTGNPTLHGEIAAINNCTKVLGDPNGPYKLSPSQVTATWKTLTLYTNAESCPMCASAIRWAGFKEYVYGTSIATLTQTGWGQIQISSYDVFQNSWPLRTVTAFLGGVLTNETDPYFSWQFQSNVPCPMGCQRDGNGTCRAS